MIGVVTSIGSDINPVLYCMLIFNLSDFESIQTSRTWSWKSHD